ncbi:ATP synthase F1 subunit gamma [Candidatus Peregrinibacteria bacterium]|nr:ATP synthase F1 subunit gamma [Candidatus Peregrinibacteria bacterium]
MGNTLRDIRRRIKGVKNTKQITKTMEMVSASKMRKAQVSTLKTRTYAEKAMEILVGLSGHIGKVRHPLLAKRPIKHTTLIVVTSDRGLCGGFNLNVINKAHQFLKTLAPGSFSLITVGKKGRDAMVRLGHPVSADFSGIKRTEFREIAPIIKMALDDFIAEKTDQVVIAYTHFINTIKQKPLLKTLLPLSRKYFLEIIRELAGRQLPETEKPYEYIIEPDPNAVIAMLIPRLTEMQIFQSVLENEASEHSARMVAMKNATDAAGDIIEELTLTGNEMRQSGITAEIAEIVTAGEAMKQ